VAGFSVFPKGKEKSSFLGADDASAFIRELAVG
jgi:hypothetical protein